MEIRNAESHEVGRLAKLWYDGWQDAHAAILPAELARLRTLENFAERMEQHLSQVRTAGVIGDPLGFCICKDDELYQLYVSSAARGTGLAAKLLNDAEDQFCRDEITSVWLACAIGNERAERFYEKSGWRRVGEMTNRLETPEGEFLLKTWRYEKDLLVPT